jgi:hypothetical protein
MATRQSGFDRDLVADARDRMSGERDTSDDERDEVAAVRDEHADERDRTAAHLDRLVQARILAGMARSESTLSSAVGTTTPGQGGGSDQSQIDRELEHSEISMLREQVLQLVARAGEDRRAAADDRHRSRQDRRVSEKSRQRAAEDRQASAADRDASAADRSQREIERNLTSAAVAETS